MRINLIQMRQTCGYDTMIDAECSIEGGRCLCPLIPPTPFSHTGRRGSVDVLMPETGDGTQALDHAPACAGAAQQRLQSPLKGLRPRARRRGRSSFTAARTSDCNRPWRASDRAPAGAGAAHQRLQSPLAGLRPRARQPGRSFFTASRTSDGHRPSRAFDRSPVGAGDPPSPPHAPAIEIAPEGPPAGRPPARAILLHRLTHQRLKSPLKGLQPVARLRGRSSFTASRASD
jgi:hypothetical protein